VRSATHHLVLQRHKHAWRRDDGYGLALGGAGQEAARQQRGGLVGVPKLRLVPVLGEGSHGQDGRPARGVVLGPGLQLGEALGVGVALGVELLQGVEGRGGENAGNGQRRAVLGGVALCYRDFLQGLVVFLFVVHI